MAGNGWAWLEARSTSCDSGWYYDLDPTVRRLAWLTNLPQDKEQIPEASEAEAHPIDDDLPPELDEPEVASSLDDEFDAPEPEAPSSEDDMATYADAGRVLNRRKDSLVKMRENYRAGLIGKEPLVSLVETAKEQIDEFGYQTLAEFLPPKPPRIA